MTELWQEIGTGAASAGAFAAGIVGTVVTEPLRKFMFRPKLRVRFSNESDLNSRSCRPLSVGPARRFRPAPVPPGELKYTYLRGEVSNASRYHAEGVKVYLNSIDRVFEDGEIVRLDSDQSRQLRWSSASDEERGAARDVPNGVKFCFDLLFCSTAEKLRYTPLVLTQRNTELLYEPGTYRLEVMVTANSSTPTTRSVTVVWNGEWDGLSVVDRI